MRRFRRRYGSYRSSGSSTTSRERYTAVTPCAPVPGIRVQDSKIMTGAKEAFVVTDMPGVANLAELSRAFAEESASTWRGNQTFQESLDYTRQGDLSNAHQSDKYLSAIEKAIPEAFASQWEIEESVCGFVPIVPAYLAGEPCDMLNVHRVATEQAPLTVIADLTVSAGVNASDLMRRGACVLALVRALASKRPVTLYALSGAGNSYTNAMIFVRIETAPLDLARACHVLTSAGFYRGITFPIIQQIHQSGAVGPAQFWGGHWSYYSAETYRQNARALAMQAIGCEEAFYISAAHVQDPMINNPVPWLIEKVRELGGASEEAIAIW